MNSKYDYKIQITAMSKRIHNHQVFRMLAYKSLWAFG